MLTMDVLCHLVFSSVGLHKNYLALATLKTLKIHSFIHAISMVSGHFPPGHFPPDEKLYIS